MIPRCSPEHDNNRDTGDSRNHRRGFLLPLVLLLLTAVLLLAFTRHLFSRQQLHQVAHLADYERAYQLACAGLSVGREQLHQTLTFFNDPDPALTPKSTKVPIVLKNLFSALFDSDGLPRPEGARAKVSSDLLGNLTGQLADFSSLEVEIEFKPGKTLFEAPKANYSGIIPDSRERQFHLFVHAEAKVGVATSRVSCWREAKLINILPPVMGKFVLFLRQKGFLGVNDLKDSTRPDRLDNTPLVISAGTTYPVGSLTPADAAQLDRQGWVFLGGSERWSLGCGAGGGLPHLADGLLHPGKVFTELEPGSRFQTIAAGNGKQVFYYAQQLPLAQELHSDPTQAPLALAPAADVCQSSLLRLCGTTAAPSPTLVVGPVYRRWALIQGLWQQENGKSIPFPRLDAATFVSTSWPPPIQPTEAGLITSHFQNQFNAYAAHMSELVEDDYNAANLEALRLSGTPWEHTLLPDVSGPSPLAGLTRTSNLLQINGRPAELFRLACGTDYRLQNNQGRPLFVGGDLTQLADLSFLRQRCTATFADQKALFAGLSRDRTGCLQLNGAVYIDSSLSLAAPLQISGGGMLIVRGPITLNAGIESRDGSPITVVSLSGGVTVETNARLQCALIAPQGTVTLRRDFHIHGLIAARELAIPDRKPGLTRELKYDTQFDQTDATNEQRQFRLVGLDREYTYVH